MRRVWLASIAAAALLVAIPGSAAASTHTNATPITIQDADPASPYPSTIAVEGLQGSVADVNATLNGVTHSCLSDLDILLVGPSGAKTLLLSGAGPFTPAEWCSDDPGTGNVNSTIAFDDEAASLYPCDATPSGTFKPTNGADDCPSDPEFFEPPAPSGPYPAALSALDGSPPNGVWQLFVTDNSGGDNGSIAGWTLDLLTDATCSGRPATLTGTAGDEELVGTEGDDVILGFGGNDTIRGLGGQDTICGGSNRDSLRGGSSKDKVVGGSGKDKLNGNAGKDKLLGKGGQDKLNGGTGKDVCKGGKKDDTAKKCEVEKSI